MTLVPNSSLGIQNTSSLLTGSLHLRERTGRDPDKPHVVDSSPRIDQRWSITVWTRHMEKLGTSIAPLGQIREANDDPGTRSSPVARSYAVRSLSTQPRCKGRRSRCDGCRAHCFMFLAGSGQPLVITWQELFRGRFVRIPTGALHSGPLATQATTGEHRSRSSRR